MRQSSSPRDGQSLSGRLLSAIIQKKIHTWESIEHSIGNDSEDLNSQQSISATIHELQHLWRIGMDWEMSSRAWTGTYADKRD